MEPMRRHSAAVGAVRSTTSDLAEFPDERLVDEALAGDRDAFGALVLRHQRGLLNYIFRLVRSRDIATDLAQEVFLKVFSPSTRSILASGSRRGCTGSRPTAPSITFAGGTRVRCRSASRFRGTARRRSRRSREAILLPTMSCADASFSPGSRTPLPSCPSATAS